MALGIITNVASLNAQRNLQASQSTLGKALQRLSSGLRINGGADDAAGLAISDRFTTQIRGLSQAARNANDGISMLQTVDGALTSVVSNLQRIRELAVQAANATNSQADKAAIQQEVAQLAAEVDRVGRTTTFNGENVFGRSTTSVVGDPTQLAILDGMQSGWLSAAESLVEQYFGISASGNAISIEFTTFTDGASGVAARVVATTNGNGPATNIRLQIDLADFTPPNPPNGGNPPFYNDRIIAHEMTHAVMDATMNVGSMHANDQQFFLEGTAELIHGADERLYSDIMVNGGGATGIAAIMAQVADWGSNWDGSSEAYSAAYAGMRYLDSEIRAAGGSGIRDVTTYLAADSSRTLDQAMANATSGRFASVADFQNEFETDGAAFINGLLTSGSLTDADTGAIGGYNQSGGPVRTAESVVPNGPTRSGEDQLYGFLETWESLASASYVTEAKTLQIGAEVGQTFDVSAFAMNGTALDIMDMDVAQNANRVIAKVDRALNYINARRADVGAQISRLESVTSNLASSVESMSASRSRILDADYAAETAMLTRQQILQQAGTAVLVQANANPRAILQLLGA